MLPPLEFACDPSWAIPDERQCVRLWDKYDVMPHIREHCRAVASIAVEIVRRAERSGLVPEGRLLSEAAALAAGLLHDLAKTYTIRCGGSHAQLGAAWVRDETGNPALAQAVLFHVSWPWEKTDLDDVRDPLRLPVIIAYADKRVRHAEIVTLRERFDDLMVRYGVSEEKRSSLRSCYEHVQNVEQALFGRVGAL